MIPSLSLTPEALFLPSNKGDNDIFSEFAPDLNSCFSSVVDSHNKLEFLSPDAVYSG